MLYGAHATGNIFIGVETVHVHREQDGVRGDVCVSDLLDEIVCVLHITGVPDREGVQVVIQIFCRIIGLTTAIRDYGTSRRNLGWPTPGRRVLVDFGQHIEEPGPGLGVPCPVCVVRVLYIFYAIRC